MTSGHHHWIARVKRRLAQLEASVMLIAAGLLLSIMLVVIADVFMRQAVNRPFSFTYDLVGLYLLAGLFLLSLSDTFRVRAHVSVDILVQHMSPAGRHWSDVAACLAGLPVFGAIAQPNCASVILVTIGSGVLVIRLVIHFMGHFASFVTGHDIMLLAPLLGHGEMDRGFE